MDDLARKLTMLVWTEQNISEYQWLKIIMHWSMLGRNRKLLVKKNQKNMNLARTD